MPAPQTSEFIAEAKEHLADVCDQLLRLESSAHTAAGDRVEQMMRAMHSVKGGAGYFGLRNIERLAHSMETTLEGILTGSMRPDSQMVDVLLAATDRMAALVDDIEHSDAVDVSDVVARLDDLLAAESAPSEESISTPLTPVDAAQVAASAPALDDVQRFSIAIDLSACQAIGISPQDVIERVIQWGRISDGMIDSPDVDLAQSPPLGPVIWRATIASPLNAEEFGRRIDAPLYSIDQNKPLSVAAAKVAGDQATSTERVGESAAIGNTVAIDRSTTIRIPIGLADRLMNLAGELVLVRNQTRRFAEFEQTLPAAVMQRFDAVTTDFQQTVLQTRMQPIGNLFNKFPRLVRDLARQLGKQIELEVRGAEVELDKTILDAISDPLTHLLRNGCDHGVEPPDVRAGQGKLPTARILLAAQHAGDQICISVTDDGRGIDRAAILRQAAKQGLRSAAELARLGDRDLLALILMPGFSTAPQVTDISGRGVGMDVVKTNLARLGGSVEIDSVAGQGTTFTLQLPLTLAIIPGVLIAVAGQRYVIAQKDLEELVCIDAEQTRVRIEWTRNQEMVRLRGRLLPLVRLAAVLQGSAGQLPGENPARRTEPSSLVFAVIKSGLQRYALGIDHLLSNEEIVVKPLHSRLRAWTIYSGATILGDGSVSLILNADAIATAAGVRFNTDAKVATRVAAAKVVDLKSVLLLRQLDGEQVAVGAKQVRRVVMVGPNQVEQVGAGYYVTVDGVPTRILLLANAGNNQHAEHPSAGGSVQYILLPRGTTEAVGFIVDDVLGTEEVVVEEIHPYRADPTAEGAAIVRGKITPLVDLDRRLQAAVAVGILAAPDDTPARLRALLVDDTQFFREVVGGYLREAGFLVTTAEHGAAALELLEHAAFDVIISDLEMPVMDGFALAMAVRQSPALQALPMVALSTLTGDEVQNKAFAAGFNAYEVKLDKTTLLGAVRELIVPHQAELLNRETCDAR